MTRALCVVALLVVLSAIAPVWAQQQAPAFSTEPYRPAANEPFQGTLSVFAHVAALGPWSVTPDLPNHRIEVFFDFGCGFICPGESFYYHDFVFQMPALPAGEYQVRVYFSDESIIDFPLQIGGTTVVAAPATSLFGLCALGLGLLWLACARRTVGPSTFRSIS